jgi:hypothetical protein
MADPERDAVDRHALVLAIWLAFGLVAVALVEMGLRRGSWMIALGGFAAVVAAFIAHVIVNAVYDTLFTAKEVALGLVVYIVGLLAFALGALLSAGFRDDFFLPGSLALIAMPAAVVFYMITHLGLRRAFESFDVIRRFRS